MDVGDNVGAKLAADKAASDLRVAQAQAEVRRAAAVAREQEMRALVEENRAKVVQAEAEVPLAMSQAFRDGHLGVMRILQPAQRAGRHRACATPSPRRARIRTPRASTANKRRRSNMAATKTKSAQEEGSGRQESGPVPEAGEVLTLAEAAAYLRVSEENVVRLIHDQDLPGRFVAEGWRFLKSALRDWLAKPMPKPSNEAFLSTIGSWKDDPDLDEMLQGNLQATGPTDDRGGVMILLDTDTLSMLFAKHAHVRRYHQAHDSVATTVITRIEMLMGRFDFVLKAEDGERLLRARRLLELTVQNLKTLPIIDLDAQSAAEFDRLRANKKLKIIARRNLLIACIALAHARKLATRNTKHFRQVPGLAVENWAD